MQNENIFFKIYKSVKPETFKKIIPIIDYYRKTKNKPPIPMREKMAEIDYPNLIGKTILLHGVSVGEIMSLENLIKKIKEIFPDINLVITTGTVTGQELAKKKYSSYAEFITYFPLDIYETVKTFLEKIKPSVILIAETELWPNFSYCAKEKEIPLYIINGRISDKSYPTYLLFKNFFKFMLSCYNGIFSQSEIDNKRFISLGADKDKTEVMKNLKFEIEKKPCEINLKQGTSKVLIAGSTHKGEDEIVLKTYKKLKENINDLKLILAPRHLTRLDEIVELLGKYDFKYGFRTKEDIFKDKDIIILDTLGELSKIYSLADVAFIGGSFNNTGGHNPLEAVVYSTPAISGPSIKNFRDIYSILQREGAGFVVKNENELYNILKKLLLDEMFYSDTKEKCKNCFISQQGALNFVINKLKEILK